MKNLIRKLSFAICILLYTCTFCLAQIEFNTTPVEEIISVTDDKTEVRVGGAEVITAKLLIAYEIECYNDSTYVEYFKYHESPSFTDSITGMTWVNAVYIPPTLIKEWQHKEPTFKDFLVWVRKKYGL